MPNLDQYFEIVNKPSAVPSTGTSTLVAVVAASALVIITLIAYLPCFDGGFILDDDGLLTENVTIRSSDGLYRIWFTTQSPDYWPLTYTMFWCEWRMWGKNPLGYHLINVALHIAASLLLWAILRELSVPGAYLAALLFALHPVNVESVAWIAQRKNTLAMLLFLASIWFYLKFDLPLKTSSAVAGVDRREPPADVTSGLATKSYYLSLFAFLLALLSKGSVAILPALLLVIIWLCRPIALRDLKRCMPFFALAALFVLINMRFQAISNPGGIRDVTILQRLLGAGAAVCFYLYKSLLPFDLAFVYPQWNIDAKNALWWFPLIAVAALTIFLWLKRTTSWGRPLLAAWAFYCIALLPVMGFTDVGFMRFSLVADHYQHIAIIAVVTLIAAALTIWRQGVSARVAGVNPGAPGKPTANFKFAQTIAIAVPAALVALYAWLTFQQAGIYHDAITLYTAAIEKNPENWMLHGNLGDYLFDKGKIQPAIKELNEAQRRYSDSDDVHFYLGKADLATGHPLDAVAHFRRAVEIRPGHMGAHIELAKLYSAQRRTDLAIEEAKKALAIAEATGNNQMIVETKEWIRHHSPTGDATASPQGP